MITEKRHVALAAAAFVVALVACKYSYTPPGSRDASTDASIDGSLDAGVDEDALAAEDPPDADKRCTLSSSETACLRGGKAKACAPAGRGRNTGEWRVFTCPSCKMDSFGAMCSDLVAGDYCSVGSARSICTKDKYAVYKCDYSAHEWKIEACPGGCVDKGGTYEPECKR